MIEKPHTKRQTNVYIFRELPYYGELKIVKTSSAFKGYAHNYGVEAIDSKYPSAQLAISRSSIKDLFKDLIAETQGF